MIYTEFLRALLLLVVYMRLLLFDVRTQQSMLAAPELVTVRLSSQGRHVLTVFLEPDVLTCVVEETSL